MMRSSNRLMSFPAGTMITVKGYPFVLRDATAVMGTPENFGEAMCELAKAEQMQDQAMDSVKMTVELTREAVEAAKKLFPAKGEIAATPDYMVPTWGNVTERKPNAETVAALHEALAAGGDYVADVGEQERLTRVKKELAEDVNLLVNTGNISRNDMFVIACGYRLRGKKIKDMRAVITRLEAKVAELSRNQVGSVCVGAPNAETVAALQEALATGKGKVAPTQDNATAPADKIEPIPCVYSDGKLTVFDDNHGQLKQGHSYLVDDSHGNAIAHVSFQNGPVPQNGVNGLTNEALLAILIHRTNILNEQFPCNENSEALVLMTQAKQVFEHRTKRRQAAGIEGKMVEQST